MPLITRQGKGEKLTIQEMDGNLTYLEGLSQDIESSVLTLASDLQDAVPYRAYRAKIAMQTVDWPGYGYLYNWYAVTDARLINNPSGGTGLTAPNEWRVPSDTDWDTLLIFAGGATVAGGKLKSTLTSTAYPFYGWSSNVGGTDNYNFNALGGGYRGTLVSTIAFQSISVLGCWWTSVSTGLTDADACFIDSVATGSANIILGNKSTGYSVRLVREAIASELLLNDGDTSNTSSLDPYTGNDGKEYITVKIGTQVWLAQNLRETTYNDNSDIFNASVLGGDPNSSTWQAKGAAQEGAWTAYYNSQLGLVQYDPAIITQFYNEVLENTLGLPGSNLPLWIATSDVNGPFYLLGNPRPWNKTHIKITPGYDVSDFPTINERSLLIEKADSTIRFRPIKKDGTTGAITIEDLNNYGNDPVSYVYVEILEYQPESYYYSGALAEGIGVSNL